MRVFTKLRAEQIKSIEYVATVAEPAQPKPADDSTEMEIDEPVEANQDRVIITTIHGDRHELLKEHLLFSPVVAERKNIRDNRPALVPDHVPELQYKPGDGTAYPIVQTGNVPQYDATAAPDDHFRHVPGDFLVIDFDIQTDKPIFKIYDTYTVSKYFRASLNG